MSPETARKTWRTAEPIHGFIYFLPEASEADKAFYEGKVAKWQIPDDVVFVDSIPLGATGKMQKNLLRERFRDHRPPV